MIKTFFVLAFVTIFFSHFAIADKADAGQTVIPFTVIDHDGIITIKETLIQMQKLMDDQGKRIDDLRADTKEQFATLKSFMGWIIGLFTTLTIAIFSFAWWDRRSMVRPFEEKVRLMDIAIEALHNDKADIRVIKVLMDLSKSDAKLAELLKFHNIL